MIVKRKGFERVYQFKITLAEIKPSVWRRIQVPEDYSFWDLHVAIQDTMPWKDYHLHQFEMMNPETGKKECVGIPTEDDVDYDIVLIPGWEVMMADWFSLKNKSAKYTYDFGDDWEHAVKLEKILDADSDVKYPLCLEGKRACPPEDVGGVFGYERFLEIISDPSHEEHEEMIGWAKSQIEREKIDPEHFDSGELKFWDPQERFEIAFCGKEGFI